jgi:hypothetical protein
MQKGYKNCNIVRELIRGITLNTTGNLLLLFSAEVTNFVFKKNTNQEFYERTWLGNKFK